MRQLLIFLTVAALTASAQAATIRAGVDGLVCSFCATGLEKTFKKQPAIDTVKVDLDSKLVTLTTKPNKDIDDATIKRLITHAGFTLTDIARDK